MSIWYTDAEDTISLCSVDAEGSTDEEVDSAAVVSMPAPPVGTCLRLPSHSHSLSGGKDTLSCSFFESVHDKAADSRFTPGPLSCSLSPSCPSLPPTFIAGHLEPAWLDKSSRSAQSIQAPSQGPRRFTIQQSGAAPIDIDLGSNEQVSNAQLHALELEYQQVEFERVQRERQLDNFAIDSSTPYAARPYFRQTPVMEASSGIKAPSPKRVKLMEHGIPVARVKPKVLDRPRGAHLGATTAAATSSEGSAQGPKRKKDKPARKTSSIVQMNELPRKVLLDGSDADDVLAKVFGEDGLKRLKEFEVAIEVFQDGMSRGPQIVRAPANKVRELAERGMETINKPATLYRDEGAQVGWEAVKTEGWALLAFDEATRLRAPLRRPDFDLYFAVQTEKPHNVETQMSYEEVIRLDASTATNRTIKVDKNSMTIEETRPTVKEEGTQCEYASQQSQAVQTAPMQSSSPVEIRAETDSLRYSLEAEAEAAAALESLSHQTAPTVISREEEPQEEEEGEWRGDETTIGEIVLGSEVMQHSAPDRHSDGSVDSCLEQAVLEQVEPGLDAHKAEAEEVAKGTLEEEKGVLSLPTLPEKRNTRGQRKKVGANKDDVGPTDSEPHMPPFGRACRLKPVDYSETRRPSNRVKAEVEMQQSLSGPSSSRKRTRTSEVSANVDEASRHPKKRRRQISKS